MGNLPPGERGTMTGPDRGVATIRRKMGHFVAIPHENITRPQSLAFGHIEQLTTMKIT